jgi:sporulation protein YlmC with PRC-barrel domain
MFMKSVAAGLAASALLVTVASAQTAMSNSGATANNTMASEQSLRGDWRTSKIVGLDVYNDNNESIGSINDLLTDKSGNIKAVLIGVGGLLGVGERLVAVPFEKIKFVDAPVADTATNASSIKPASTTTTGAANSNAGPTTPTSAKSNPWYPDHAVFNATKDELKTMPEFKYSTQGSD